MKRANSNRSPIFSPKNKKKALKKQGTGIFGRFSPDNWPATKSPSSTKENTIVQAVGSCPNNKSISIYLFKHTQLHAHIYIYIYMTLLEFT